MSSGEVLNLADRDVKLRYQGSVKRCRIEEAYEKDNDVFLICIDRDSGNTDTINVTKGMLVVSSVPPLITEEGFFKRITPRRKAE